MNIALTGGGTAGHIIPNIALLDDFKKYFDEIYYIGNEHGMEYNLTKNLGINFLHCDSVKLDRVHFSKNALIPFMLPKYVAMAKKLLKSNDINIVFSKGGYVALPTVLAANMLNIPVVCHESDKSLGLTNKITSVFAKAVITSFKETKKGKKYVCLGTPIRSSIFNSNPNLVIERYKIPTHLPIILIVGGSIGAKAINEVVYSSIDILCEKYFVLHICGKDFPKYNHKNYVQLSFVNDIENYLSAANVIVSRCGATIAMEISALNKKVVYIPLSKGASRGDQVENANYYKSKNIAQVLYQEDLNKETLIRAIDNALTYKKSYFTYDRQTNKKIALLVSKIAKNSK